jgi:hypothetical protein
MCHLSYELILVGFNLYRFLKVGYCIYDMRIFGLKISCCCCDLCCRKMWRFSYLFKIVDRKQGSLYDSRKDWSLNNFGGEIRFGLNLTLCLCTCLLAVLDW